jgi:phosphate transport system protein
MSDHTMRVVDKELAGLSQRVAEMGGLAGQMVSDAMNALSGADSRLAQFVVQSDPRLDALQREIEEQAIEEIARRQPVADDLRSIIGAIRIAGDLERVGDLAKNIARRAIKIGPDVRLTGAGAGLRRMAEMATGMLTDVLDSYARHDAARAHSVWVYDAELDSVEDAVFRDILTHMMENPRNITFCAHLLFCSKNIERVGDHATNIAETVYYMVTGGALPIARPKGHAKEGGVGIEPPAPASAARQSSEDAAPPGASA